MTARCLGLTHIETPPHVPRMGAILPGARPKPPPLCNWHAAVPAWPMLANDRLGTCVPAGVLHGIQARMANAWGSSWAPTDAEAEALYAAWADWDATRPETDIGTDVPTAMAAYASHGIDLGLQAPDVAAHVSVYHRDLDDVRRAIAWFGGIGLSLDLPKAAQRPGVWDAPAGPLTGDAAPGSWGAHYVFCGRYAPGLFWLVTWGAEQLATDAFLRAYLLGADAALSRDWLRTTGISPPGLDFDALRARVPEVGA